MSTPTKKQLFQVKNIVETLEEATDHFSQLVKNKELKQSIFMFSSIVEGFGAIKQMLSSSKEHSSIVTRLEQYLLLITKQLEHGNFIKISEILQFSFTPQLKKLKQSFIKTHGEQTKKDVISIGVFAGHRNPREFYMESRVNALVNESQKQNANLYFFTSTDVDFENREIIADTFLNHEWKRVTVPFPDVINNVSAGRRSHIERKLRREIPFTSFHVGNKLTLPKRILKYRKYAELIVPFKICTSKSVINRFFNEHSIAVFKPIMGNRGENIYFVTKKDNRYVLLEHTKERILSEVDFNQWLDTHILRQKGSYIVQRYIHSRTKSNEPYHIRAQVQKNGQGKWVLTHVYPSIGDRKSHLSNLSAGGHHEDLHEFMINEHGDLGQKYADDLEKLSLEVAQHLDKLYGFSLEELGLDFAIDENGRYWMYEANNGPNTRFFDDKRAVHTIAYAKYIAKNGIMHTDTVHKFGQLKGQFEARNSSLPVAQLDYRQSIGMLVGKETDDSLSIQIAKKAKQEQVHFYFFKPQDIDFDYMLIKGHFYENDEWIPKIVEYPDVIIDRLKLRGDQKANFIYEDLEDIPFTNEWSSRTINRVDLYEKLKSYDKLQNILVPFERVTRPRDIFRFIKKHRNIVVKPTQTFLSHNVYIQLMDNDTYRVTRQGKQKQYHELQLSKTLRDLIKNNEWIVQADQRIRLENKMASIHIHLLKDKKNEWTIISSFANIQTLIDGHVEEKKEELLNFFKNYIESDTIQILKSDIKTVCKKISLAIEELCDDHISENNITIGFYHDQVRILDSNPDGPQTIYNKQAYASAIVAYATSLIMEN